MTGIIIINDITTMGGVEKYCINLRDDLYKIGYDFKIVSLCASKEKLKNCDYLTNKSNPTLFTLLKLFSYIKKTKPKVAIGTNYKINCILSLSDCKAIGTEHVAYEKYKKWQNLLKKIFYKQLFAVISLTKNDYYRYKTWKKCNVINIPNYIYLNEPQIIRDCKVRNFLAIGRLTDQKGFDLLIDAFELVKKAGYSFNCKIIGEGPLKNNLETQILNYGLSDMIKITDFMNHNELLQEYKKNDCFLLSSRHEGMPFVLLEALSYSLPTISFDCPTGPKEIVDNDINGYLVINGDIKSFAEKIIYILELGEEKIKDISINAYSRAKDFSVEKIIIFWDKLLKDLK